MDKKAKKILLETYWSAQGWKSAPTSFTGEEFEYAKSQGTMFDRLSITHDAIIQDIHRWHQEVITKEQVMQAFLHSLSTRQTHGRSILSSWALTVNLPLHTYEERRAVHANTSSCGDCNFNRLMSDDQYTDVDINVLNFERIKWGGIRLNHLLYCWLDLKLFMEQDHTAITVTPEDIAILQQMIQAIEECNEDEGARKLEKRWKDLFPANKHERDVIMEIWGYAGLLVPLDTPRKLRGGSGDFNSVAIWQGEDRYSSSMLHYYFGTYL
ncbi:hypothetical protein [Paenibacillus nuruki]|uniref:hypothetical protein n=1 Tax=Paenibacillus nuruki TaxID=1886670 RepID=UPI002805CCCD|nr:hypothetical protein [Paenibacillus nuruki]CAJ1314130.1 DUF4065 domain-containing protein [Paenibacillus nuruki]